MRREGRSAFIRAAVEAYLRQSRSEAIDAAIERGYLGAADELLDEVRGLIEDGYAATTTIEVAISSPARVNSLSP